MAKLSIKKERSMKRHKVSIIGAGAVGAIVAQNLAQRDAADIVLLDVAEGIPQGKALDLLHASPIYKFHGVIEGTNDYASTVDSNIVVITAGMPRKPGMSRKDLLSTNAKIMRDVVSESMKYSPEAVIMVVANPVDVLTHIAYKKSGLPRNRVIGLSGTLDSIRLQSFIAQAVGVSAEDVMAMVIGAHGKDNMLPLMRLANVCGIPVKELLDEETLEKIEKRTREAGAEVVSLLKTRSAFYGPGAIVAEMIEAILKDRNKVFPAAVYLTGEYGINDCTLAVPVILGKNGIKRILEINLTEEEKASLHAAAQAVKEMLASIEL